MKRIISLVLLCAFAGTLFAQNPAKYWVQFRDKANSPYSIERPEEFLSPRAIEKRQRFNIEITEQDLPVNESYIKQLLDIDENMVLLTRSKWLNGVTVYTNTKDIIAQIKKLDFVVMCECTVELTDEETFDYPKSSYAPPAKTKEVVSTVPSGHDHKYGYGTLQIGMNNAHWLHRLGAHGEGMLMAVMDVGFENVNKLDCFDALRSEGRLLGTKNFVFPGRSVFIAGSHGTEVLSCIASYVEDNMIGTAPKAMFYLAKTEDSRSENKIEEDNWVAALEWADSLGCDVINSSLGYYKFDNKSQSYHYEEITGKVSRASQAASLAASKGIIVCVSAGNEGDEDWHYITCPADADNILTVGAIDRDGSTASFSSYGPTADGRVKPDAAAVGSRVYVVTPRGKTEYSYGTSFSSPVLSGMVACLWQLFPNHPAEKIIDAVRRAGINFNNPTDQLGYGITDFISAYNHLSRNDEAPVLAAFSSSSNKSSCTGICYAKRNISTFTVEVRLNDSPAVSSQVIKVKGTPVNDEYVFSQYKIKLPKIPATDEYGIAHVRVICPDGTSYEQIIGLYK